MKKIITALTSLLLCFSINIAHAGDVSELKKEIQELKQMLRHESQQRKALESKVDGIEGRDERLTQAAEEGSTALFDLRDENSPFSISGGVTGVIQGTSGNSNAVSGTTDRSSFATTFDLTLSSRLSENQRFNIDLEAGQGDGVNNSVNSAAIPNFDPYNTSIPAGDQTNVTISAIYYEGAYQEGNLVVTLGKINPQGYFDENNYANDETAQFLSSIFVMSAGTILTDADNYYAPSLAVQYAPSDYFELTLLGVANSFDDIFSRNIGVAQINVKPHLISDREGNYRFYVHFDQREYNNIANGTISDQTSYGLSIDQELMDGVGIFFRAAWQDDSLTGSTDVSSSYSGGINLNGSLWDREGDEVGIAYGTLNFNKKVLVGQKDENHFEIYYSAEILDQVHISPDYQYIQNVLSGPGQYRNVSVFGVRGQFDF